MRRAIQVNELKALSTASHKNIGYMMKFDFCLSLTPHQPTTPILLYVSQRTPCKGVEKGSVPVNSLRRLKFNHGVILRVFEAMRVVSCRQGHVRGVYVTYIQDPVSLYHPMYQWAELSPGHPTAISPLLEGIYRQPRIESSDLVSEV